MASKADIGNLTLGRLRIGQSITTLDDETPTARVLNRFYDQSRQEVLRAFPWGCALRAEALALVAGQTFPGWTYVYQYPQKCLMVRCVADESGMRTAMSLLSRCDYLGFTNFIARMPWQTALKDDNASQVILSDVPNAWVFYTYDLETVGVMQPDLVSTIAWRLAAEAGNPLQADDSRIEKAEQMYVYSLSQAAAQSLNESRDDARPESPSISCRY